MTGTDLSRSYISILVSGRYNKEPSIGTLRAIAQIVSDALGIVVLVDDLYRHPPSAEVVRQVKQLAARRPA